MAFPSNVQTVLVCDDETILRILVRATLARLGFRVLEASDGNRALTCIRKDKPDLVLLDLMLPGRSGSEILAEVRGDPDCASTPVVLLSARAQAAECAAGLAGGADLYLFKPFSPRGLVDVVKHILP
jgi:two-component system phosphate regulon response regulator PhoB